MSTEPSVSCYNCIHHNCCKFEPEWVHTKLVFKNEKASERWFKEVPTLIAELCNFYMNKGAS